MTTEDVQHVYAKTVAFAQETESPYAAASVAPSQVYGDLEAEMINRYQVAGLGSIDVNHPRTYFETMRQSRFFYHYDPIGSTTINRIADMAITPLTNEKGYCSDEEFAYYNALAKNLYSFLQQLALEYLVNGMALPDFVTSKVRGRKISAELPNKVYSYPMPDSFWVRNPETVILKKIPASNRRSVVLRVPDEDRQFILTEGMRPDGIKDYESYRELVQMSPEYVQLIKEGKTMIPLTHVRPIMRKIMSHLDYPQPFLQAALTSLKHKLRIKQMDYSIATKALEAICLIKAGSDEFPLTEGPLLPDGSRQENPMLSDLKSQFISGRHQRSDSIFRLFTNHTVTIQWVFPPLEALLSDLKYTEPNADIFLALGFPRQFLVGESQRSNAGHAGNSILGPMATLEEVRTKILEWVQYMYEECAKLNRFENVATPSFIPLQRGDVAALVQFAIDAVKIGALSRNTLSQLYGTDFERESRQLEHEAAVLGQKPLHKLIYIDKTTAPVVATQQEPAITPPNDLVVIPETRGDDSDASERFIFPQVIDGGVV